MRETRRSAAYARQTPPDTDVYALRCREKCCKSTNPRECERISIREVHKIIPQHRLYRIPY